MNLYFYQNIICTSDFFINILYVIHIIVIFVDKFNSRIFLSLFQYVWAL